MKIKLLILTAFILILNVNDVSAQCATSTCITNAMIDEAATLNVTWNPVDTHYQYLDPTADCSAAMIQTGIITYKWYADEKTGVWLNAPDYFCLLPGCDYFHEVTTTSTPGAGGAPPTTSYNVENPECRQAR